MRPHERIPLHDHRDLDSGGLVAQSTVVTQVNSGSTTTIVSGATTASDVAVADTGGYFTGSTVEEALAELGAAGSAGIPATIVDAKGDLIVATAADTVTRLAVGSDTFVLTADAAEASGVKWAAAPGAAGGDTSGQLIFGWDGGGAVIDTAATVDVVLPFAGTITGWTILADQAGSAVFDLWDDTYANYPPTVLDTITAAAKPTLSGAVSATSTTLTGWTTALTAGHVMRAKPDSASSVTRVVLVVAYSRP